MALTDWREDAARRPTGATGSRRVTMVPMPSVRTLATLVLIGAVSAGAQPQITPSQPWKNTRTSDGQPDLQGIWSFGVGIPLERPGKLGEKQVLDEETGELAEAEKAAVERNTRSSRASRSPGVSDLSASSVSMACSVGGSSRAPTRAPRSCCRRRGWWPRSSAGRWPCEGLRPTACRRSGGTPPAGAHRSTRAGRGRPGVARSGRPRPATPRPSRRCG